MNCPTCEIEMKKGRTRVRGTLLGFLFVGMSHQHLFFEPECDEDGQRMKDQRILKSGVGAKAFSCPECTTLIISREKISEVIF